jgi:hypothetical protein
MGAGMVSVISGLQSASLGSSLARTTVELGTAEDDIEVPPKAAGAASTDNREKATEKKTRAAESFNMESNLKGAIIAAGFICAGGRWHWEFPWRFFRVPGDQGMDHAVNVRAVNVGIRKTPDPAKEVPQ